MKDCTPRSMQLNPFEKMVRYFLGGITFFFLLRLTYKILRWINQTIIGVVFKKEMTVTGWIFSGIMFIILGIVLIKSEEHLK